MKIDEDKPRLVWLAAGMSVLGLEGGGAAVVRERWERSGRTIECIALDAKGKRRFVIQRPEATKTPTAELGRGVLLFHSGSDVAIATNGVVTYSLSLPDRKSVSVTTEPDGAWIEYEGIVDFVDSAGVKRGRWRVG
jgi:hypothetical protein